VRRLGLVPPGEEPVDDAHAAFGTHDQLGPALTGWHEPKASHLRLLEAVAGRTFLRRCYDEALERGYLWHEFGDLCLLLP